MNHPSEFLNTVRKRQIDLNVTDKELRRVVGWSESTQRRRYQSPENITLGEADRITNYLGIK